MHRSVPRSGVGHAHPDGAGPRTPARELLDAPEPVDAAPLVEAPGPGEDTDPGAFEDRHDPDLLSELLAHEEELARGA